MLAAVGPFFVLCHANGASQFAFTAIFDPFSYFFLVLNLNSSKLASFIIIS